MTSYRLRRKEKIFTLLGSKCKTCGLKDDRVLQIDHVNSDGAKERKLSRIALYNKVEEEPKRYQLLCANCNWRKRDWEFKPKHKLRKLLPGIVIGLTFLGLLIIWRYHGNI